MPDASRALVSFNAGEFSPKLWSRLDQAKAASACRLLENMIVETYGTVRRRPGTKFVAPSNNTFVSGVPPVGPPGMHVIVNRSVDSTGEELTDLKRNCFKSTTTYTITFISRAGDGCLIGYNEYGTPSDPPLKFRRKTFSGAYNLAITLGGCLPCNYMAVGTRMSGFNQYDKLTAVLAANALAEVMNDSTTCVAGTVVTTQVGIENLTDSVLGNGAYQVCATTVSNKRVTGIAGVPGVCDQNCYPVIMTEYYTPSGMVTIDLSDEDTFADALVRSGAPTGTAADTLLAVSLGGFCYTGHSSEWSNVFTDLKVGCSYTFVITYTRGPDTITESTTFVAGSTSETLTGVIPPVLGTVTSAATGTLFVT